MKRKSIIKEGFTQVKGRKPIYSKQIREAPRQKIRQLLQSFISVEELHQIDNPIKTAI